MAKPRKEALTSDMIRLNRGDNSNEQTVQLPEEKKSINLYVSPYQMQGFKVPIKDENGKIQFQINPITGRTILIAGHPVPITRDCNFLCQSNNIKKGCLSYFEAKEGSDEDEVLRKLADDPNSPIVTDVEYRRTKDIVKFKLQEKLKEKEEITAIQKDYIAELEERIQKLTEGKNVT